MKVGDKVKTTNGDEGTIAGKLRTDGYYPVKLKRLAYLNGIVHIKPQALTRVNKGRQGNE